MAKRNFNWTPAIVLVIALTVLTATAVILRQWQRNRMAYTARETGLKAYEKRLWHQASKNLGRYLAINHNDIQILLKYAEAQLNKRPVKQGNIQQAAASYRTILRLDKNNSAAAEKLVSLYLKMDVATEAELIAERHLQIEKNPKINTMLATALARQRKFPQASQHLQAIITEYPGHIPAYEILGQLTRFYPADFPATPEYWFDEAVKNNPSSAEAYIIRAGFYLTNAELSKAVTELEKAEKMDLSNPRTRLRLARGFIAAGRFEKARIHLSEIKARDPANRQLWQSCAQIALRTNSKDEMLSVAKTALKELAQNGWDFLPLAVELFIKGGELVHARNYLARFKQTEGQPVIIAYLEGLLAEAKKEYHKAILFWRDAQKSGDKSPKTRLALARTYWNTGDSQSALLQLRQLISEQPDLFQGRFELGRLLYETGRWAEAAEQGRIAAQIAPDNPDAALLHIQAQIQFIANNRTSDRKHICEKLEKQLAELEDKSGGQSNVKLLQFQLAMLREQFTIAKKIIEELKTNQDDSVELATAEVDLLVAENKTNQAIAKLYTLVEKFPQSTLPAKYLAILLSQQNCPADCEKVLTDAVQDIDSVVAKRDLAILLACFYEQWDQVDKAYQLLTKLSKELPYDIPIKRQLLENEKVSKNPVVAEQLITDIKSIEAADGWQWRYEQAKLLFPRKNFVNRYPQIIALLKQNLVNNPADQTSRILLAAAYDKAGESQLAVATYREALNHSPHDLNIIAPTVAAMYKAKEFNEADEILNRVGASAMTEPRICELKLQSYLRRGNLSSAEAMLEDLMAEEPNNHAIPLSLALLKMRRNAYSQAHTLLKQLKARRPFDLPTNAALVELNIRRKKIEEALALCDQMIEQLGSADAYILRGRTSQLLSQHDKAAADFERAVVVEPNNIQAWVIKSNFNRSIDRLAEALKDIKKALELSPENLQVQKRAIALLLKSGEPDKIHQGNVLLDEALLSNPQDIELRLCKARSLMTEATPSAVVKAEDILQKITKEQPEATNARALLARIYLSQAHTAKAMDIVLRGLTYQPNNKKLLLLKARAEANHCPHLAIPTLELLHKHHPNDTDIVMNLAGMYMAAGRYSESASIYKQILQAEPNTLIVINNLAWMMCEVQNEYQQALELAQRGLEKAPEYIDLIDTRGVIYYRLGQCQKAAQDFSTCLERYQGNAQCQAISHFHLARALIDLGQSDKALTNLQKAQNLSAKTPGMSTAQVKEVQHLLNKLMLEKQNESVID